MAHMIVLQINDANLHTGPTNDSEWRHRILGNQYKADALLDGRVDAGQPAPGRNLPPRLSSPVGLSNRIWRTDTSRFDLGDGPLEHSPGQSACDCRDLERRRASAVRTNRTSRRASHVIPRRSVAATSFGVAAWRWQSSWRIRPENAFRRCAPTAPRCVRTRRTRWRSWESRRSLPIAARIAGARVSMLSTR